MVIEPIRHRDLIETEWNSTERAKYCFFFSLTRWKGATPKWEGQMKKWSNYPPDFQKCMSACAVWRRPSRWRHRRMLNLRRVGHRKIWVFRWTDSWAFAVWLLYCFESGFSACQRFCWILMTNEKKDILPTWPNRDHQPLLGRLIAHQLGQFPRNGRLNNTVIHSSIIRKKHF